MNVSDRSRLYRKIRRVLNSGAWFAIVEAVLNSGEPFYPVPWARTSAVSFLLTAAATGGAIEATGFAHTGVARRHCGGQDPGSPLRGSGPPAPNLGVMMGSDLQQLSGNLGRNLMECGSVS